jgi:hypothetical protein
VAFEAGESDAVIDLLTQDVEIFASPELANPGTFHGRDGYLDWIAPWVDAWQQIDLEISRLTPVGESHVIAEVHQVGHGRQGIEVTMDVAFLFDVNGDGLIRYLALIPGHEQALALAHEREAGG